MKHSCVNTEAVSGAVLGKTCFYLPADKRFRKSANILFSRTARFARSEHL